MSRFADVLRAVIHLRGCLNKQRQSASPRRKRQLNDAHDAIADANAAYEVLLGQIGKYSDLDNDIDFLSKLSQPRAPQKAYAVPERGKGLVLNFGKYKGIGLREVNATDPAYFSWILKSDFPQDFKDLILKELFSDQEKPMRRNEKA
ncbi:MAG: hypothetical protein JNM27_13630 [Leptospirales bacterium]|nr:hypothetical protein [Leptospirales bacterium]